MPQQPVKKQIVEMHCKGMGLGKRTDLLEEGEFIFLQNTRVFADGIVRSRPTLVSAASLNPVTTDVVHSMKTIIDQSIANFTRFAGAGTKLYSGMGAFAPLSQIVTGFSGLPLSIIDFRPTESISPYVYVADKNKMIKASSAGVASPFGLNAPKTPPTIAIDKPSRKTIDLLDAASIANWVTVTGSAAAGIVNNRVTTTITAIILDDAAVPSFCSIIPVAFTPSIQEGLIVRLSATEDVFVEKVEKAVIALGVATVSKIIYDVGATGLCTITTSIAINDLEVDSVLKLNAAEFVRVTEIVESTNNSTTFRCKTVGTIAAGNSIEGFASFRTFITLAHIAGDAIFADAMKSVVSASGLSSVGRIFNSDLTNTSTRGLDENDLFHISLQVSDPSKITEIQIQLDINDNTFTKDYLYKAINPNFLTASANQTTPTIAVQQQIIQREEVQNNYENFRRDLYERVNRGDYAYDSGMDISNPVFWSGGISPFTEIPNQLELGQLQWSELTFKLSEFLRFGSAENLGLKDVKAIRITVNATAAVDLYVDSIWIGGGFGLTAITTDGKINPFTWVYCYEEAATRQRSSWSPPNRNGLFISRGRAKLLAAVSSELAATDRIIWARFGGNNNDFRVVGAQPNDGTFFYDEFADSLIAQNEQAGEPFTLWKNRKPFTVLDKQRSGTCNVIGNKVVGLTGDTFNVNWARGSQITIDNIPTALYTFPTDTTHLEIEKDIGPKTNVKWFMPEARIVGQPLPVIFGPFGQGQIGLIIFGLGDDNAAGTIYWLNGNDPGLQDETNYLEITSPSEPLVNGVIYDGVPFVWTTERSYVLIPSFVDGELQFSARENANSKGLFARRGICVGKDYIYYITTNGIVRVQGIGNPESITDKSLQTLFPHAGYSVLTDVFVLPDASIIYPPDFTKPDEMWLFYENNQVWFRFIDTQNKQRYLIYNELTQGWISYDKYEGDFAGAIYAEEGMSNFQTLIGLSGNVFTFADTGIIETNATKSIAYPPYQTQGDERFNKQYLESAIDLYSKNPNKIVEYSHMFDNGNSITDSLFQVSATNVRKIKVIDILTGQGNKAKNISTFLRWNTIDMVSIYALHYAFIEKVETTIERLSQFYDAERVGDKQFRSMFLEADTFGNNKNVYLFDDKGVLKAGPIVVNHNGQIGKSYSFTPFIASKVKISPFDYNSGVRNLVDWDFYSVEFETDKVPELDSATSQWFNDEDNSLKYLQGFVLTADTDGIDVDFDVQGDNEVVLGSFRINSLNVNTIPFDFPIPVLTHQMRIVPKGNIRIYNVKWKFDKEPELAYVWEIQETTFGLTGYIQLGAALTIGVNSTAITNLVLTIDGEVETYEFASTGGLHKKLTIILKAAKGRLYKGRFYSTQKFRLYKQECEVKAKSCNDPNDFQVKNPFGDVSNIVGAEI
jgi:hypothetical protein